MRKSTIKIASDKCYALNEKSTMGIQRKATNSTVEIQGNGPE